jgi:hypothetical protein
MGRPSDWSPVAAGDPVPGDVADARDLARRYARTAEAIRTAGQRLRQLHAAGRSQALDAFREVTGDTASKIEKAEGRYQVTADALGGWADDLEGVQAEADAALGRAKDAEIDRHRYDQQAQAATDDAEKKRLERLRDDAQGRVDAERRRVEGCHDTWNDAGNRRAGQIKDIIDHDDVKDSFWDNLSGVLSAIANIAGAIAAIAGVAALLVGWIPVIGQALAGILGTVALIATAVSLVLHLALLIGGKGSWGDVLLDAFSLATFGVGRAFTSAAKASTLGSRALTRVAAARGLRGAGMARGAASATVRTRLGSASGAIPDAIHAAPKRPLLGAREFLRLGYGGLLPGLRGDAAALGAGLRGGPAPFRAGLSTYANGGNRAVLSRLLGQHELSAELTSLRASRQAIAAISIPASNAARIEALARQGRGQLSTAVGGIFAGSSLDVRSLGGLSGGDSGGDGYDVSPPSTHHTPAGR